MDLEFNFLAEVRGFCAWRLHIVGGNVYEIRGVEENGVLKIRAVFPGSVTSAARITSLIIIMVRL